MRGEMRGDQDEVQGGVEEGGCRERVKGEDEGEG